MDKMFKFTLFYRIRVSKIDYDLTFTLYILTI